jgi:hypothetical protein
MLTVVGGQHCSLVCGCGGSTTTSPLLTTTHAIESTTTQRRTHVPRCSMGGKQRVQRVQCRVWRVPEQGWPG